MLLLLQKTKTSIEGRLRGEVASFNRDDNQNDDDDRTLFMMYTDRNLTNVPILLLFTHTLSVSFLLLFAKEKQ